MCHHTYKNFQHLYTQNLCNSSLKNWKKVLPVHIWDKYFPGSLRFQWCHFFHFQCFIHLKWVCSVISGERDLCLLVCWPMVSGQGFLASFKTWKRTQASSVHFKMLILSLEVHLPPATWVSCVRSFLGVCLLFLSIPVEDDGKATGTNRQSCFSTPQESSWKAHYDGEGCPELECQSIAEAPCQVSCYSAYSSKVRNASRHCWNINEVICLNHFDSDLGKIWKTNKGIL